MDKQQEQHNQYYLIPDEEIKPAVLEIKAGHKYLIVLVLGKDKKLSEYQKNLLKATFEQGLQKIMQEAEYTLVVVDQDVEVKAYEVRDGALHRE